MTSEELKTIIEEHGHWLNKDCDGWEHMRADLSYANLKGAILSFANLTGANLSHANLTEAKLSFANLIEANLSFTKLNEADLSYANLTEANLSFAKLSSTNLVSASMGGTCLRNVEAYGANLYGTYLGEADLSGAVLSGANMIWTDLHKANLTGARLVGTNLYEANLRDANINKVNLTEANLCGAELSYTENIPIIPYACPDTGSFIGWKKAHDKIVCLEIPEYARRLSATGRKCRCDRAKVISITELDGSPCNLVQIASNHDKDFIYRVGETVSVPDFDENRWNECGTGIHFFINREEAVVY